MVARPGQTGVESSGQGVEALAESGLALGLARTLGEALHTVARTVVRAVDADVAIARILDEPQRRLNACAVATASAAIAAELEGSRVPVDEVPDSEETEWQRLPEAVRRAAERAGSTQVVLLPVYVEGELRGSLELMRRGPSFDEFELRLARLGAAQAGLAIRAFRGGAGVSRSAERKSVLVVAGEALAAGADDSITAEQVTRLAAEATGAVAGFLWRREEDGPLALAASFAPTGPAAAVAEGSAVAERALVGRRAVTIEEVQGLPDADRHVAATLQLGQPPVGALQLLFPRGFAPGEEDLAMLATFGVRAAHALRASVRSRRLSGELDRTRALLAVVGQAISQLSLAHTLETAVARVGELLDANRLAVYLREDERLFAAAALGLTGPHARLADRLLELILGPFRSRGILVVSNVRTDPRLAGAGAAAAEAGIEAVIAVPLLAQDEVVGLLGVFPEAGRVLTENESALLAALAAQLAVAVQNAQLHERAKLLGEERERALESEKAASKQVRALYEISRSFAQSLSLEATLQAVARTIVEVLDVDAALIRMPDERREWLVPRAMHVAEPRVDEAVRSIFFRRQPFGAHPVQRLFRRGEPFDITPKTVAQIGAPATIQLPFLERGWTGAAIPIATPAEVLASLTIISMRPGSPVTDATVEQARAIAGQAALAIDNARLYQQQKEFADTMQRSLLPRSRPELEGLELGDAYESSARVEVGGDVYDFVVLDDGRLAVALGDVTGHGIEAAADMAMAKFVFRSLTREHPEPADFLQFANDVIVGEIAPGKFITMVYLVIDSAGAVAAAGAGHPPPRILAPDGTVSALEAGGLVLGIESNQEYEEVRAQVEAGGAVVLYTDGVLEARHDGELYGLERLDRVLSKARNLPATELAQAVLEDCRAFARGELADDCAVVVVKKTA
jgi:serine phosphatase RsbU (regulator of sigma subunit)